MAVTNADILGWFNANPNADVALINQTMKAAGVSPTQLASALGSNKGIAQTYLTQQILGQGTTDKWQGEGKGSAQANAADMANILAGIGITDINQFGQITKEVPTYSYDEYGIRNQTGTETVTTYGNKVTGQEVPLTYGERQTGNAFGGTYTGKDNTGYRVEFDASGKPVFYTTAASSSDAADWMPIVQLALAATGAGGLLGNALLGAGANQIAANALGSAILGGATTGLAGGDILKGALLGGAAGAVAGYFSPSTGEITATPTSADSVPFTGADYNLANGVGPQGLDSMGGAQGLQAGTSANLANMGGAQGITLNLGPASTTLANALSTFGGVNPSNLDAMGGGQGLTYQTPTGLVTQGGLIPTGGSTGNNNVIGETGINTAYNIGNGIGDALAAVDTGVDNLNVATTPVTSVPKSGVALTTSDVIKLLGIGTTIAGIGAATGGESGSGATQYPIVEVPSDWRTPTKTGVAQFTPLPTIDFGNRNLLRGTQWEKFLDPNYGQVPEPVQYSQPSNLSYNDLMGILGSKQGMPLASALSINDIISGIQNQYGQAPNSAVG